MTVERESVPGRLVRRLLQESMRKRMLVWNSVVVVTTVGFRTYFESNAVKMRVELDIDC